MNNENEGKKQVLLRLSEPRYEKLRKISTLRTSIEGKHVSMQKVMDELLDDAAMPDSSQQSS